MGSMETSRRNLLKAGTAAAAAVAAAPLTAQAAVSAENTKFDATYDVVVVGSGFARRSRVRHVRRFTPRCIRRTQSIFTLSRPVPAAPSFRKRSANIMPP